MVPGTRSPPRQQGCEVCHHEGRRLVGRGVFMCFWCFLGEGRALRA